MLKLAAGLELDPGELVRGLEAPNQQAPDRTSADAVQATGTTGFDIAVLLGMSTQWLEGQWDAHLAGDS